MSETEGNNFIHDIINQDLAINKNGGKVVTRFPPEPNGYLHLGHAKAICLNFNTARKYGGLCNLRMDDTNPAKESEVYTRSIIEAVHWLGFDWGERLFHASDYFEQFYQFALELIRQGKAYVCDLTMEEIKEYRGTLTAPGINSPYRDRSITENLTLFQGMKEGEFADGVRVLRAKIDMSAPNINMRDPIIYRIRHLQHPRTKERWCIYPMYDYAHCVSDALEGITHSLCTLEFEDHRPLYDWYLNQLSGLPHPQQIEFARLNLTYMVMSKRKLLELVEEKLVDGWDDPRLPTLMGIRRRGYPPQAIVAFCQRIGVTKQESTVELGYLEECVRERLNHTASRLLAVLRPLKVVLTNFAEGTIDYLTAPNHPQRPEFGERKLAFTRELYIEQGDFMENPEKGFFRLAPGREVRLRYGYVIRCNEVIKDAEGKIVALHCTYDPNSRGGEGISNPKVKGIIHWVSATENLKVEVRLYDRLFKVAYPEANKQIPWKSLLNPYSLEVIQDAVTEQALSQVQAGECFQLERLGYFCLDYDTTAKRPVINRTVGLKDSWEKLRDR